MTKLSNPSELKRTGALYCRLMEEILVRDELIQHAISGELPITDAMPHVARIHELVTGEFCYFQLRMICELIALACLAVNGDLEDALNKRTKKAYQADFIINALSKLHNEFYPRASVQARYRLNSVFHPTPIAEGFLTKQDLLDLYAESGGFLHCGNVGTVKAQLRPVPDFERIKRWTDKIWTLLEHHHIFLINPDYQIIALMKTRETSRPQFSFWKRRQDGNFLFDRAVTSAEP